MYGFVAVLRCQMMFSKKNQLPTGELSSRTATIHCVNKKDNQQYFSASVEQKQEQKRRKKGQHMPKFDDGRNVPFRDFDTQTINQPRREKM